MIALAEDMIQIEKLESTDGELAYYLDAANVADLLKAVKNGTLVRLLKDAYAIYEAEEITELAHVAAIDDRDLLLALTDLFPSIAARLSPSDRAALRSWLPLRRAMDGKSQSAHTQAPIVTTQEAFVRALRSDAGEIFLFDGEFALPLLTNHAPVQLHGIHNPIVNIRSRTPIQLGDLPYTMDGVTLFLSEPHLLVEPFPEYAQSLQAAGKILSDDPASTNGSEGLWAFDRLAEGRQPYASHAPFQTLVAGLPAIAIGTVTLCGDDYDREHQAFRVRPVVRGSFLDFWENGPAACDWFLSATFDEAEALMETQRKSRLFAEFDVDAAGKLFICALFIRVAGRAPRYLTQTPRPVMSEEGCTSGSGIGGYGLDLIDIDEELRQGL